jgi:hypothetical protein
MMPAHAAAAWAVVFDLSAYSERFAARLEIDEIRTRLGARWSVLYSVIIAGIEVTAWGATSGLRPDAAAGYLACALDWLVDFYSPPAPPSRICAAEIEAPPRAEAAD